MDQQIKRSPIAEDEEIDLYEVCIVLKRRLGLILGVIGLCMVISVVWVLVMKPVYRTEIVVQVPQIGQGILPDYAASDLDKLKILLNESRFSQAATALGISVDAIQDLAGISYTIPRGQKRFFRITIDVYRTGALQEIAEGVVKYLNKNKYVKDALLIEKKNMELLKKEIQDKISSIEALKNFIIEEIKRGRVKDLGFNPFDLDDKVIELKVRLNEVQRQLTLLKGYEMVVSPVVPTKPAKPKKLLIVSVAFVGSAFVGVFIAFFVEFIEKAKAAREPS